jgi:hypothetical protein
VNEGHGFVFWGDVCIVRLCFYLFFFVCFIISFCFNIYFLHYMF